MKSIERLQEFLTSLPLRDDRSVVTLNCMQRLDGSIAVTRNRPLRMSGRETRTIRHALLAMHDAIAIGIGTVLADDPRLTGRYAAGKDPQPVIFDSTLRFPLDARILSNRRKPWLFTNDRADMSRKEILEKQGVRVLRTRTVEDGKVDLHYAMRELKFMGCDRVLVQGGTGIIHGFMANGLVDACVLFITGGLRAVDQPVPTAIKNYLSMSPFPRLEIAGMHQFGNDLVLWGKYTP